MSVFFFWGGGGDGGVVNAGYLLPLSIGLHHLPRVHVRRPVDQQNNSTLFVHFVSFVARLRRVKKNSTCCQGSVNTRQRLSFSFPDCSEQSFLNSAPEKFANICQIERGGISAMKFKTARIHFLSDVIAAPY